MRQFMGLVIPERFYQSEARGQLLLTDVPTGALSVEALMSHSKQYWIDHGLSRKLKPKKIILSDWTIQSWRYEKTQGVIQLLTQLLDHGFSVYLDKPSHFEPLTKENLHMLEAPESIERVPPCHSDSIYNKAREELRASKDETLILDDCMLQELLRKPNAKTEYVLDLSAFTELDELEQETLVSINKQAEHPYSVIVRFEVDSHFKEARDKMKKLFPNLKVEQRVERFISGADDFYALFDPYIQSGVIPKESLVMGPFKYMVVENLPEESLERTKARLGELSKLAPDLLSLEVYGLNWNAFDSEQVNFPNLEELYLEQIDGQSLANLLKLTPKLKKLTAAFSDSGLVLGPEPLTTMEHLERLRLQKIDGLSLRNLLKASPKLKELQLESSSFMNSGLALGPEEFSSIENLYLSCDGPIAARDFEAFLKVVPHVKTLNVGKLNLTDFGTQLNANLKNLEQIRNLILRSPQLSVDEMATFLQMTPNVQEIIFSQASCSGKNLMLAPDSLSKLHRIELSGSTIRIASIAVLLHAAPNLKTLKLERMRYTIPKKDAIKVAEEPLKDFKDLLLNLEHLSCEVDPNSLLELAIIERSPYLKRLELELKSEVRQGFKLPLLGELEELSLRGERLHHCDAQSLFHPRSRLKSLSISEGHFGENLKIEPGCMQHLEQMNFTHCSVEKAFLEKLLIGAPGLKVLSLERCTNMDESDVERFRKLNPKIVIQFVKASQQLVVDNRHLELSDGLATQEGESKDGPEENPVHKASDYKDKEPLDEKNFVFRYKGKNKTKNQGMVIEKLSQYLTLKKENTSIIPKIQDGICTALTKCFNQVDPKIWDSVLGALVRWNGDLASLDTNTQQWLTYIHKSVMYYQLGHASLRRQTEFLGDNLGTYLKTAKTPLILNNPWHAIAVRPVEGDRWVLYDPNHTAGPRVLSYEELLESIHTAIGSLVSVESNEKQVPKIGDPDVFFRDGGLLAISSIQNVDEVLSQLPEVGHQYSQAALEGLLLRDVLATPAWISGMSNPHSQIQNLTSDLLQQFKEKNPNYESDLQTSLQAMAAFKKLEFATELLKMEASKKQEPHQEQSAGLFNVLHTVAAEHQYQKLLETWEKKKSLTHSLLEYCQVCLQPEGVKKRLIPMNSPREIDAMRFALEAHCQKTSRPFFYVHSPEDLVCTADYIKREGDRGIPSKQPGGRLYDFLKANSNHKSPVIIVNYASFKSDDIVSFNSLLDKKRVVDGQEVPEDALIIGLNNQMDPNCYQEQDFNSRFERVEECSLAPEELMKALPNLPLSSATSDPQKRANINLFHAGSWEAPLLGGWQMAGSELVLQEGALIKALKEGKSTIEIQNGLWGEEGFVRFWEQACHRGEVEYPGGRIAIPKDFCLIQSEGYPWDEYLSLVQTQQPKDGAQILNPTLLPQFLSTYTCDNSTHTLTQKPGLIAQAKESLEVHVTRTLTEDEWAMVLDACNTKGIKLKLSCAPGVKLPHLEYEPAPPTKAAFQAAVGVLDDAVIVSSDMDVTVAALTKDSTNWQVIDISECKPSDLLEKLDAGFENLKFHFTQSKSAVLKGLEENKSILLKGHCSAELADQLIPLFTQRMKEQGHLGQLVLVTNQENLLQALPLSIHEVSEEEKKANTQLKSETSWEGMLELKRNVNPLAALDASTSAKESQAFTQARLDKVAAVLDKEPYVFLAGLSGVGKSTFVCNELSQHSQIFQGKEKIKEWALAQGDERQVLFIDEATLLDNNWSEFEGLFEKAKGILIDGVYYPVSNHHKVVFAGNPVSYGDERQLASLFQRHGNSVVFEPLPTAVLYEEVLKPVFAGTDFENKAQALCTQFLEVYRYLVSCSTKDVLISPRELQMMAIMTLAFCANNPEANPVATAKRYAYELAKNLVPAARHKEFDEQFNPKSSVSAPSSGVTEDYLITPSRYPLRNQLDELLQARLFRQRHQDNQAIGFGGLGGIIVEGEPGIGKSELIYNTLVAHGYKEMKDPNQAPSQKDVFYKIPVRMSLKEKRNLLIKAANEGAVVFVDEINSSPMIEHLMNDLLMGKIPGKEPPGRPDKPGFMVIGTQNPASMSGRRVASTALLRRVVSAQLPTYTEQEMRSILIQKGLDEPKAQALIDAYMHNRKIAAAQNLKPPPCFRDLLNAAESIVHAKAKSQMISAEKSNVSELVYQAENPTASLKHELDALKTAKPEGASKEEKNTTQDSPQDMKEQLSQLKEEQESSKQSPSGKARLD
jgi:MoxR-like ATPase